jgi:hypothetical protein
MGTGRSRAEGSVPRIRWWRAWLSNCHDDPQPSIGAFAIALAAHPFHHLSCFRGSGIIMALDEEMSRAVDVVI